VQKKHPFAPQLSLALANNSTGAIIYRISLGVIKGIDSLQQLLL